MSLPRDGARRFSGEAFQSAIYLRHGSPWPIGSDDWQEAARAILEQGPYDYVAGGAGAEATMRANREAFDRHRLRPRMLAGNKTRDLSVEVLGGRLPFPIILAPIGVLSIAHADGELAVARAAAATGVPFTLSTAASHSIEEIATEMGDARRWFQLYWVSDREVVESLVRRAEASGYEALVVTLDTPVLGWRPSDLRNIYLPFLTGEGCRQFFTDPVFLSRLAKPPEEDLLGAAATMLSIFPNLSLTWTDLDWLRAQTKLPILVKGILTAEDALTARQHGVDGVIVSNHGGRQVDGAVAALDAFIEVRAALGDEVTVLMDGGIRSGVDVIKALALGADAVLVGRPFVFALAVGGQAGVEAVIQQILAEADLTLALSGGHAIGDLDRSLVTP